MVIQVPFGDSKSVREWLHISGTVAKPTTEHPKRPIQGLGLAKIEVSGSRFWGLMQSLCGEPDVFFRNCYVHNYCPLCFMATSGKNITPPTLKAGERSPLQEICDRFLVEVVRLLEVEWVVGIGKYAEERSRVALGKRRMRMVGGGGGGEKGGGGEEGGGEKGGGGEEGKGEKGEGGEEGKGEKGKGGEEGEGEGVSKRRGGRGRGEEESRQVERGQMRGERGSGREVKVSFITHPSPINPAANKDWTGLVTSQLSDLRILDIIKGDQ